MITFWLIAAVFVAIALAFVLPPLLERGKAEADTGAKEANLFVYRDQLSELDADLQNGLIVPEQHQQDREEIERRLLSEVEIAEKPTAGTVKPPTESRWPVYALALGIPVVAVVFYLQVGTPAAMSARSMPGLVPASPVRSAQPQSAMSPPAAAPGADGPMTEQRIEANIAGLAKRLEENPGDVQGWRMLARSYSMVQKYDESSKAYARAAALKTDDADLLADYALALTMARGQQVEGEPLELVKRALKIEPENPKALQLAGGAAFQAKRYKEAIDYWQRVLNKLPPDSELAQALSTKIAEAKSLEKK